MWKPNYLLNLLVLGVFLGNTISIQDKTTKERIKELKAQLNEAVDPCDDFYEYSCGNYKNEYPMPDYKARFDVIERLSEENYKKLDTFLRNNVDEILEKEPLTAEDKAKVFYSVCNNITKIDEQGLQPLLNFIETIGGLPARVSNWENSSFNWFNLIMEVQKITDKNPFFGYFIVYRDADKVTNKSIPYFSYVPEKVIDEKKMENLCSILDELGLTKDKHISTVNEYYKFYNNLEGIRNNVTQSEKTDTIAYYEKLVPSFNWRMFLSEVYGIILSDSDYIRVDTATYFVLLTNFLQKTNPAEIANFIMFNLINDLIPALDQRFLNIQLEDDKISLGIKSRMPRWRHCIEITISVFNKPLAALFIKQSGVSETRHKIDEILKSLKSVYSTYLQNSAWPGQKSKTNSLLKLEKFKLDLSWENFINNTAAMDDEFRNLSIDQSSFLQSYVSAMRLKVHSSGSIIMTQTQEVWPFPLVSAEAFVSLWYNSFSIHPGLMRSPYYHKHFPKFLDLGGLGFVIAHEMFHSFDTLGSRYDANGLLNNWWMDKDYDEFKNRTQCYIDQYDNYDINGTSLKDRPGDFENIADNIGLKFAYMAYDKFLNENSNLEDESAKGLNLTSRQLFFVAIAQCTCTQIRLEAVKHFIKDDPHTAGPWRVIGMIQNSKDFATEFKCSNNSRMNPQKKCELFT